MSKRKKSDSDKNFKRRKSDLTTASTLRYISEVIIIEGSFNYNSFHNCVALEPHVDLIKTLRLSDTESSIFLAKTIMTTIYNQTVAYQNLKTGILIIRLNNQKYVVIAISNAQNYNELKLETVIRNLLKIYEKVEIPISVVVENISSRIWKKQLEYWKITLEKNEIKLNLPNIYNKNSTEKELYSFTFCLSMEFQKKIQNICRELQTEPSVVLLTIFLILLHRYTQDDSLCITVSILSLLKNSVYFSIEISSEKTVAEIFRTVTSKIEEISSNDDVPFNLLKSKYFPQFDLTVAFKYSKCFSTQELKVSSYPSTTNALLSLCVTEQINGFDSVFYYDKNSFTEESIQLMSEHFQNISNSALDCLSQDIASLSLLTSKELELFELWNHQVEDEVNLDICIHQLFEQQVQLLGDQTAIYDSNQKITYSELNKRSNQLAHHIRSLGINKNCVIAVLMNKSIDLIVTFLAILKSGNAYLPIDPNFPQSRVEYQLSTAKSTLMIANQQFRNKATPYISIVLFEEIDLEFNSCENLPCNFSSSSTAYILFTSGTTGNPKGVEIQHKNTIAFLHAIKKSIHSEDIKGILIQPSPTFCLFHGLLYQALLRGSTGILVETILHIDELPVKHKITFIGTPPSGFSKMVHNNKVPSTLKCLSLGGEILNKDFVQELQERFPDLKIYLVHGCTEAAYMDLIGMIGKNIPDKIDVGKPLANIKIYIVDKNMQRVPVGFPGELCVSGPQITKGYLNNLKDTAMKFVKNKFENDVNYDLLYRVGDIAKWTKEGRVEICGRMDFMVKINGIRIELEEIAANLLQYPGITEAVVTTFDTEQSKNLIAYLVVNSNPTPTSAEIQQFLKSKLPYYMIPRFYKIIDKMPRNINGKIDRSLLPQLTIEVHHNTSKIIPNKDFVNCNCNKIISILSQFLKRDVNINENLLEIGLDSVVATQFSIQLEKIFKVKIPIALIYENPNISDLGKTIEQLVQGVNVKNFDFDPSNDAVLNNDITNKNSHFTDTNVIKNPKNIFLTGSTGFLGAFILMEILTQTKANVHCLIREGNKEISLIRRLINNLNFYKLWKNEYLSRISIISGDLVKPEMGIDSEKYHELCLKIDTIYHCAAEVNFVLPYSALKSNAIKIMEEILRFAFKDKLKALNFISSIAVHGFRQPSTENKIKREDSSIDLTFADLPNMGYAKMKWISEKLVWIASTRGLPVVVYRPSFIFAHSNSGSVSTKEYVLRLIKDCVEMKMYPDINRKLLLIPVDYASKIIVELSKDEKNYGRAFHLTPNIEDVVTLNQLMNWINEYGYKMKAIQTKTWLLKLEKYCQKNKSETGLKALLHYVEENFTSEVENTWQFDNKNVANALKRKNINHFKINYESVKVMLDFLLSINFLQPLTT